MKKYILISLALLLVAGGITAFVARTKSVNPKASLTDKTVIPTKSYLEDLRSAGFTNLPSFIKKDAEEKRAYYKEKYGVTYFSESEMKNLLADNGFLMGGADYYIGNIPLASGKGMVEKLNIVSATEEKLDRWDFRAREFVNQEEAMKRWEATGHNLEVGVLPLVFIAAPKEKFDLSSDKIQLNADNTIEAKNPDPIALYKIKGGWLELARW